MALAIPNGGLWQGAYLNLGAAGLERLLEGEPLAHRLCRVHVCLQGTKRVEFHSTKDEGHVNARP